MRAQLWAVLAVGLFVCTGCPDDGPVEEEEDSGSTMRRDAAPRDAVVPPPDTGSDFDAGVDPDAAPDPDAAIDPDATSDPDATDPDATSDPDAATDPDASDPDAADPDAADPDAGELDATIAPTDATATDPDATATDPDASVVIADATATDPDASDPDGSIAADASDPDGAIAIADATAFDPDASDPDASPITDAGLATVLVIDNGVPQPSIDVILHDPTGAAIGTVQTNALGTASFTIPPNGMITAVLRNLPGAGYFRTVAGVMPGDSLRVGSDAASTAIATTVDATLATLFPGATYFELDAGCTASTFFGSSTTVDLPPECVAANGTINLFVRAEDSTATTIAYAIATDVLPVLGGTTAVTFNTWRTDFTTHTVDVTNAPPLSEYVYVSHHLRRYDITYRRISYQMQAIVPGAGTTFTFSEPNGFADEFESVTTVRFMGTFAEVGLSRRVGPLVTTTAVDLTAEIPSRLSSAALNTTVPQRPVISWTTVAPLQPLDALTVYSSWIKGTGSWTLTLPADTVSPFQYPEIPPPFDTATSQVTGVFEIPSLRFFGEIPAAGYSGHKTLTLPHTHLTSDYPAAATEVRTTSW